METVEPCIGVKYYLTVGGVLKDGNLNTKNQRHGSTVHSDKARHSSLPNSHFFTETVTHNFTVNEHILNGNTNSVGDDSGDSLGNCTVQETECLTTTTNSQTKRSNKYLSTYSSICEFLTFFSFCWVSSKDCNHSIIASFTRPNIGMRRII